MNDRTFRLIVMLYFVVFTIGMSVLGYRRIIDGERIHQSPWFYIMMIVAYILIRIGERKK